MCDKAGPIVKWATIKAHMQTHTHTQVRGVPTSAHTDTPPRLRGSTSQAAHCSSEHSTIKNMHGNALPPQTLAKCLSLRIRSHLHLMAQGLSIFSSLLFTSRLLLQTSQLHCLFSAILRPSPLLQDTTHANRTRHGLWTPSILVTNAPASQHCTGCSSAHLQLSSSLDLLLLTLSHTAASADHLNYQPISLSCRAGHNFSRPPSQDIV